MTPRILYPLCSIDPIRIGKAPCHGQWRQNASDLFVGFRQKHSHQIDAQRRQGQHGNPSCQPTPANGRPLNAPLDLSVHSSDLLRAEVAHSWRNSPVYSNCMRRACPVSVSWRPQG